MTASKSSRARAARAQGARTGNAPAPRADRNGTAVKAGTTVKAAPAVKPGPAVKAAPAVKPGPAASAGNAPRTVAARDGRGSRGPTAVREVASEAPATGTVPLWLQLVTFALALAGLGVSIYLTIAHFTESTLLGCSESGLVNCTKVTTSPQSYVFGIPVAVLGLAFYVVVAALMSPWAWRAARYRREIYLIRMAAMVAGIGFVLYLLYAELFLIGSICLYCTSVHAITFVLFVLTGFAAAAWGIPERQRG
jgi:uncharacterized membrane protein